MSVKDVCRLCLATSNLVWIFDKRIKSPDNMKDVIFITTGVEKTPVNGELLGELGYLQIKHMFGKEENFIAIGFSGNPSSGSVQKRVRERARREKTLTYIITEKDIVSQKICSKCCQITLKMFKFRSAAIRNDKELKAKCIDLLRKIKPMSMNAEIRIKEEKLDPKTCESKLNEIPENSIANNSPSIHHSVSKLYRDYPEIKLPPSCLNHDLSPVVILNPRTTLTKYLRRQKKKQKMLARKLSQQPVNNIRKFLEQISNKSTGDSLSKPQTTEKMYLLKNQTTKLIKRKPRSEAPAILPLSKYNFVKTNTSGISEHPAKIMKLTGTNSITESMGVASPSRNTNSILRDSQPLINIEKSHKQFICKVCNFVHYSRKHLKLHQRKHLKCSFCKAYLESWAAKSEHLGKCSIRNTITLPEVHLTKLENDVEIQKMYPEVIRIIKNITKSRTKDLEASRNSTPVSTIVSSTIYPPISSNNISLASTKDENGGNIVDLSNDVGFEISPLKITEKDNIALPNLLTSEPSINNENYSTIQTYLVCSQSNSSFRDNTSHDSGQNRRSIEIDDTYSSIIVHNSARTSPEDKTSNDILKPDIIIKNQPVFNIQHGPELEIIKAILKTVERKPPNGTQKNFQHDSPLYREITANEETKTCDLKNLRSRLEAYKIPIEIRHSNILNVQYINNIPSKRLIQNYSNYWYCFKPIDFNATQSVAENTNQIIDNTNFHQSAITNTSENGGLIFTNSFNYTASPAITSSTSCVNNVSSVWNGPYFNKPSLSYSHERVPNCTNSRNAFQLSDRGTLSNIKSSHQYTPPNVFQPSTARKELLAVPVTNYNPVPITVNKCPVGFSNTNIPSTYNIISSQTTSLNNNKCQVLGYSVPNSLNNNQPMTRIPSMQVPNISQTASHFLPAKQVTGTTDQNFQRSIRPAMPVIFTSPYVPIRDSAMCQIIQKQTLQTDNGHSNFRQSTIRVRQLTELR